MQTSQPKQTQATPGPWFAVNDGTDDEPMMSVKAARIAGQKPGHVVAICATGDSPQPMENANARLIAAAPDLRDAADMALNVLIGCVVPGAGVDDRKAIHEAQSMLRAALAKLDN